MTVVVTGATGVIGRRLLSALLRGGHEVRVVSRDPARTGKALGDGVGVYGWDTSGLAHALEGASGVVNLAGESIFGRRWSRKQKDRLRSSRIERTRDLVATIGALPQSERPPVFVSSSAIGYYGPRDDTELDESAAPGDDFLAKLCVDWEAAAEAASEHGTRVVVLRTGVVLTPEGGALDKMRLPFKLFVGGPVLPGSQWVSWIHVDDLIDLIQCALDDDAIRGPLNGTAPAPVTNREFSRAFGRALGRPSWLPVPGFALRLRFGQVASILTAGQRVLPRAALAAGCTFAHAEVEAAMGAILGR